DTRPDTHGKETPPPTPAAPEAKAPTPAPPPKTEGRPAAADTKAEGGATEEGRAEKERGAEEEGGTQEGRRGRVINSRAARFSAGRPCSFHQAGTSRRGAVLCGSTPQESARE